MLKIRSINIVLLGLVMLFWGCKKTVPTQPPKPNRTESQASAQPKNIQKLLKQTGLTPSVEFMTPEEPLIEETFESYQLNVWPSAWSPDANVKSDPKNNQIIKAPGNSENQVLKMQGAIGGCWGALCYYPCDFPVSYMIELMVRNGSEKINGCHPQRASLGMRQGTYWHYKTNPSFGLLSFEGTGVIQDAAGNVIASYQTDRWYHIRIFYSRHDSEVILKYWIDENLISTMTRHIQNIDEHRSLDHFELNSGEGTVYFDNILLYAYSERLELRKTLHTKEAPLPNSDASTPEAIEEIHKKIQQSDLQKQSDKYEQAYQSLKAINEAASQANMALLKTRLNNNDPN